MTKIWLHKYYVFTKKKSYYHIDEAPSKGGKKKYRMLSFVIAFVLMGVGVYLFLLLQSPEILATEAAEDDESELIQNNQNFIKIERINALVPFNTGDEKVLEKGAWHRYPERGDPDNGGNFILSAHRFQLGLTPNDTKDRSPFYHIDKLQNDDIVDIFYNKKWYTYQIKKTYSVKPEAVEIENPSEEAKLTIYSCTLRGSADGRVVIEAIPIARTGDSSTNNSDAVLL